MSHVLVKVIAGARSFLFETLHFKTLLKYLIFQGLNSAEIRFSFKMYNCAEVLKCCTVSQDYLFPSPLRQFTPRLFFNVAIRNGKDVCERAVLFMKF